MGRLSEASCYRREEFIISKIDRYIDRYGLKVDLVTNIDLRNIHLQYFYNRKLDKLLTVGGVVDRGMLNSPHYEFASLYYKNGEKWLDNNFKGTKYSYFRRKVLKKHEGVPRKKLRLLDSMRDGYLKKGFEESHIVVLREPLIISRYKANIILNPLEIFMGHHRVAALLALGINNVEVVMAKDIRSGSCDIYGKLSGNYRKALKCGQKDMN
jgi:hypothetical protein